eukprot:GHRR01006944.1.p1 GENE.GHRR01006944.1~~GHRR01006944.1.p1  ORF type:complete len:160 (+),score=41.81 GHRR01006944.1:1445-1924(+)
MTQLLPVFLLRTQVAYTLQRQLCSPVIEGIAATAVHLHKREKVLEVRFATGVNYRYSAELLRVCSPSADNRVSTASSSSISKVPAGRRHVGITGLELVGNYAIRVSFDDLHSSGIYTWEYLHDLGQHKYSRAKQYIRLLRQYGLSRAPQRGTSGTAKSS